MKRKIPMLWMTIMLISSMLAGCMSTQEPAVSTQGISQEQGQAHTMITYQPVQDFGFTLFKENMKETNPVLSPVKS